MTIGSDFYLLVDRRARHAYYAAGTPSSQTYAHGTFLMVNSSTPFIPISGVLGTGTPSYAMQHIVKGMPRELPIRLASHKFCRLLPGSTMVLGLQTASLVDALFSRSYVRDVHLACQFAALQEPATACHGRLCVLLLCD